MAVMLELAERARAEFLAEQLRLEHAIVTAIQGAGLTIVRTEPVQEVAASPAAVHRMRTEFFQQSVFPRVLGQIGSLTDLPVVVDEAIPLGEVHLRPHPRPDGESES
jgi:hypothetical protein